MLVLCALRAPTHVAAGSVVVDRDKLYEARLYHLTHKRVQQQTAAARMRLSWHDTDHARQTHAHTREDSTSDRMGFTKACTQGLQALLRVA